MSNKTLPLNADEINALRDRARAHERLRLVVLLDRAITEKTAEPRDPLGDPYREGVISGMHTARALLAAQEAAAPDEEMAAIRRRARALVERDPVGALSNVMAALAVGEADALRQRAEEAERALTFTLLRTANATRCARHYHEIDAWSLSDWCTAVAGEVGELAGVIKNIRRAQTEAPNGHAIPAADVAKLAEEAADVVIYLDLLCARAGVELGAAVAQKFNEVSRSRLGSDILLPEDP